ncbi:MAG: YjdF family protein [Eggerthellaceae bacterium]|nr:YjdF family protein [Eggerthellaceae bacterium]
MRKIGASTTCTVCHDGQFWVGTFERVEDEKLSVCRIVFGAEPSNEEVQQLVCKRWNRLRFTRAVALGDAAPKPAANPKRRQREAARELKQHGPSTKAQQALSEEREALARQRKAEGRKMREQEKQERFEQRQQKRKQKHRGK